ncbi:RES family NAD+ phosphorylase [Mucilaginibacter sp. OK098]|uniref:RES family NAD+ phosphorylase n=1 Tax=Mucilaginibacter sp. OK098 TaxID=1855297 RepID=UPI00091E9E7D|nr:RES family NAD+ phosphorylase [Mucilaginibacter sp. OK098]SHN07793.1 RES domain-containing protein [Mucilaginibacter sp. OK098]
MIVYRIAKTLERAEDLSGFGSFKFGGRWNSKGTYMLYTSENSSLAYLESLVHFNEADIPSNLYITSIEIKNSDKLIYQLPDSKYSAKWQLPENFENKLLGDKLMFNKQFLAIKVRSAINSSDYNFLLNPLFPGYHDKIIITSVQTIPVDNRLIR